MTDKGAELYLRFLSGEADAMERLIQEYSDSLIRFVYLLVKDSAAAEDIAEDVFATLYIKRKNFKTQARFKTYLYRIAKNKCVDFLRANKRLVPLCDIENVLHGGDFEEEILKSADYKRLYLCIDRLPQEYRQVLQLVYFEGFNVKDACSILQKSAKQVYNLLHRAKASLKKYLLKKV